MRKENLHTCPCCGYMTLPSPGAYFMCPVCDCEDDGTAAIKPWKFNEPNKCSLVEAQTTSIRNLEMRKSTTSNTIAQPENIYWRDSYWRPANEMDRKPFEYPYEFEELRQDLESHPRERPGLQHPEYDIRTDLYYWRR